jgi:nucleotide-binding universal stress UspA family protein
MAAPPAVHMVDTMSTEATTMPFDEAVVGVDGRDGGRDAVALAVALGAHRLTLAGAYAHEEDAAPSPTAGRYRQRLHDDMARALEATKLQTGVAADVVALADSSPARALHHVAQERHADLIVVGSAHRGPVGRMVLGDVSRGTIHDSPCPVAVAPHGYRRRPARAATIAVGYDGRPEAVAALRLGAEIAAATGAVLEVHVVWEGPTMAIAAMTYSTDLDEMMAEDKARAQRVLDDALAALPQATRGVLHHGSPRTQLEEVSAHADVLVLGSRGWGAVKRVAVGSTADYLLHHAGCPVIVVPRGAVVDASREGKGDITTIAAR